MAETLVHPGRRRTISESSKMTGLQHDVVKMDEILDGLHQKVPSKDPSRLLIVLAACKAGREKLNITLPRLIDQANDSGLSADVLVGLDNVHDFSSVIEACRGRVGELIETGYRDDLLIEDAHSADNRMMVVDAAYGMSLGKNNSLRVLNDGMINSMEYGVWSHPPALTLEIDDDTWIYPEGDYNGNGLQELIDEQNEKMVHAIGARWHNAGYKTMQDGNRTISLPDPSAPVSPEHRWLSASQARWFQFMPGGATLGDTKILAAARWPIGHRYPGSTSDDIHRTLNINELGIRWAIADRTYVFNEARDPWVQILRWLKGTYGLRYEVGKHHFTDLHSSVSLPQDLVDMPKGDLEAMIQKAIFEPSSLSTDKATW